MIFASSMTIFVPRFGVEEHAQYKVGECLSKVPPLVLGGLECGTASRGFWQLSIFWSVGGFPGWILCRSGGYGSPFRLDLLAIINKSDHRLFLVQSRCCEHRVVLMSRSWVRRCDFD